MLSKIGKYLIIRYSVAMTVIVLLIIASPVVISNSLNSQSNETDIIDNLSRQRLLSQKISKGALALLIENDSVLFGELLTDLHNAHDSLGKSHKNLSDKESEEYIGKYIPAHIFREFVRLNDEYLSMKNAVEKLFDQITDMNFESYKEAEFIAETIYRSQEVYLSKMNYIISDLVTDLNYKRRNMIIVITSLMILILLILFFEILSVFVPTIKILREQWNSLQENNIELEKRKKNAEYLAAKAEAADVIKGDFIANISHEIRTPMNGVVGIIDLLFTTELDDEQLEFVKILKNSSRSLLVIINDLLDFSKMESGKLDIKEIDFDLKTLMNQFSAVTFFRAEKKGLLYSSSVSSDLPVFVRSDPGRIKQILTNLVGNSIKFTDKGEIKVTCKLADVLESSYLIRFSVEDSGIGIPEKKQDHLFDKFSQLDSSTTRKYGGTGLGLAICQELAELMSGDIGFESVEGVGSTFWFTIEVKKSEKSYVEPDFGDVSSAKVLYVDDNRINREIMGAILAFWNIDYSLASNGPDGLKLLREAAFEGHPFDIALLDMLMPGMDGHELGRIIKNDETIQNISLAILTSTAVRGDAAKFEKAGFSAFLTKPISKMDIYDCLAQIVGARNNAPGRDELPAEFITRHTITETRKSVTDVLLVESDRQKRSITCSFLEMLGYVVDDAENGEEALEMLCSVSYDLVFMNINLPEMDGLSLVKEIRNETSDVLKHDIPVIAIIQDIVRDKERSIDAGMSDYICEPVDLEHIENVIQHIDSMAYIS